MFAVLTLDLGAAFSNKGCAFLFWKIGIKD